MKSSDQPKEGGDQGNENPVDDGAGEVAQATDPQVAPLEERDAWRPNDHLGPMDVPISTGLSTPAINTLDVSTNKIVRATLHPVLPGCNSIQHK